MGSSVNIGWSENDGAGRFVLSMPKQSFKPSDNFIKPGHYLAFMLTEDGDDFDHDGNKFFGNSKMSKNTHRGLVEVSRRLNDRLVSLTSSIGGFRNPMFLTSFDCSQDVRERVLLVRSKKGIGEFDYVRNIGENVEKANTSTQSVYKAITRAFDLSVRDVIGETRLRVPMQDLVRSMELVEIAQVASHLQVPANE